MSALLHGAPIAAIYKGNISGNRFSSISDDNSEPNSVIWQLYSPSFRPTIDTPFLCLQGASPPGNPSSLPTGCFLGGLVLTCALERTCTPTLKTKMPADRVRGAPYQRTKIFYTGLDAVLFLTFKTTAVCFGFVIALCFFYLDQFIPSTTV
jgi:hypothetical protein